MTPALSVELLQPVELRQRRVQHLLQVQRGHTSSSDSAGRRHHCRGAAGSTAITREHTSSSTASGSLSARKPAHGATRDGLPSDVLVFLWTHPTCLGMHADAWSSASPLTYRRHLLVKPLELLARPSVSCANVSDPVVSACLTRGSTHMVICCARTSWCSSGRIPLVVEAVEE